MSVFIVWVDRQDAKVFEFSREKMERRHFKAPRHADHHTHRLDELDRGRRDHALFSEIARSIGDADKILIVGPGVAKHHFQNFLTEQFPAVGRKVVACETVDHPSDPQIAAQARKFFAAAL